MNKYIVPVNEPYLFGKEKINTGSIYDTENRIKIVNKDTKPKLENVIEWKLER